MALSPDNPSFEFEDPNATGFAVSWAMASVSSQWEVAGFGDGRAVPPASLVPFETFRGDWGGNEDYVIAFEGVGTDLEAAVFDVSVGPEAFEDFEDDWGDFDLSLPFTASASFDGLAYIHGDEDAPWDIVIADPVLEDPPEFSSEAGPGVGDAWAGAAALVAGSGGTFPTDFQEPVGFRLTYDDNDPIAVKMAGPPQDLNQVVLAINAVAQAKLGVDVCQQNGGELDFVGTVRGTDGIIILEETEPALLIATDPSPYALADGQTLFVKVDDGGVQTVTFSTADFDNIANATAAEVAAVLARDLTGATADTRYGIVRLLSDSIAGSSLEVTGGTAASVFDFPAGERKSPLGQIGHAGGTILGTGNVGNVNAVTAEEYIALVNGSAGLDAVGVKATTARDKPNRVSVYSVTPITGTISVDANGTIFGLQGFQGATGNSAEAVEDLEESWGVDGYLALLPAVTFAMFDSGLPEAVEDFEEEWSNDSYATTLPAVSFGSFLPNSDPFEDFESVYFDRVCTADPVTDYIKAAGHGIVSGDASAGVILTATVSLPAGLTEEVTYFAENETGTAFQLAFAVGGSVIDITSSGLGTIRFKRTPDYFWTEELVI